MVSKLLNQAKFFDGCVRCRRWLSGNFHDNRGRRRRRFWSLLLFFLHPVQFAAPPPPCEFVSCMTSLCMFIILKLETRQICQKAKLVEPLVEYAKLDLSNCFFWTSRNKSWGKKATPTQNLHWDMHANCRKCQMLQHSLTRYKLDENWFSLSNSSSRMIWLVAWRQAVLPGGVGGGGRVDRPKTAQEVELQCKNDSMWNVTSGNSGAAAHAW